MPTFRKDIKLGTMVPLIKTDDIDDKTFRNARFDSALENSFPVGERESGGNGEPIKLSSFTRTARKIHFASAADAPFPSDFVCHLSRFTGEHTPEGKAS